MKPLFFQIYKKKCSHSFHFAQNNRFFVESLTICYPDGKMEWFSFEKIKTECKRLWKFHEIVQWQKCRWTNTDWVKWLFTHPLRNRHYSFIADKSVLKYYHWYGACFYCGCFGFIHIQTAAWFWHMSHSKPFRLRIFLLSRCRAPSLRMLALLLNDWKW